MPRVRLLEDLDAGSFDDNDRRTFTKSRRRTKGKHTAAHGVREIESPFHRHVRKGEIESALVHVHISQPHLSDLDRPFVHDLLETISKNGLRVVDEIRSQAFDGLRSCMEWFLETARPRALKAMHKALEAGPRHLCAACKLLEELLAPKVAELAT